MWPFKILKILIKGPTKIELPHRVNDNRIHTLTISRSSRNISLVLDDTHHGNIYVNGALTILNTVGNVFLGGGGDVDVETLTGARWDSTALKYPNFQAFSFGVKKLTNLGKGKLLFVSFDGKICPESKVRVWKWHTHIFFVSVESLIQVNFYFYWMHPQP